MNPAHLHLLTNHFPVMGALFGLLLLAAGILRRSDELKKAALIVLVLSALVTIPVYLTGEPAEGMVEGLPGVGEGVIEPHEEAATLAFIALGITGAFAVLVLLLGRKPGTRVSNPLVLLTLLLALIATGLMARTANLGGKIRHTEIRSGAAVDQKFDEGEEDED